MTQLHHLIYRPPTARTLSGLPAMLEPAAVLGRAGLHVLEVA
ncbi:hypothetical protein ACH3Y9_40660 [Streptomyces sp. WSLK1-5]